MCIVSALNAGASQTNMHASACTAEGNGMLNAYFQPTAASGISSTESFLCPIPNNPSGAPKTLYVDGKNNVTQTLAPTCSVWLMDYQGKLRGNITKSASLLPGSWELAFALGNAMQPQTWDYLVLECTVSSSVYGGLIGYTIVD
jgi:hypothetical protein